MIDEMVRAAAKRRPEQLAVADAPNRAEALGGEALRLSWAEIDNAVDAEEVGGMEHVDVEGVALDPLPAVEKAAQLRDVRRHSDSARILDREAGRHLIGDGADAADPRGDVGRLGVGPPP